MKNARTFAAPREVFDHDLDALLHPAQAYARPIDVVADAELTLNEKRAILAAWGSDACAIEGAPSLRRAPGSGWIVRIDEILEALRTLDKQAGKGDAFGARRSVGCASIKAFCATGPRGETRVAAKRLH